MTDSADNVITYTRRIEIRLAEPQPRVRFEKNKPVRDPVPDMQKVIAALEEEVTHHLQIAYGSETEVVITTAKAQDIRLTGTFQEKVTEIKKLVGEVLGDAFENLEVPGE